MVRYETIKTTFWEEPDMQDWSPDAKLLYAYLLTSPVSHGITGVYPITDRTIAHHTNLRPTRITKAFNNIGLRVRRYPESWLWIVAMFKHRCASPNHFKGACHYLRVRVPDLIVVDFVAHYGSSDLVQTYVAKGSPYQGAWEGLCS